MNNITKTERKILKEVLLVSMAGHYKTGEHGRTITTHTKQINLVTRKLSQEERERRLKDSPKEVIVKMSKLLQIVSHQFGVSVDLLKGHKRQRKIVEPRQIFCYIAYYELGMTYKEIGAFLGGRDHTTIIHAVLNAVPIIEYNTKGMDKRIKYITKLYNVQKYAA